MKKKPEQYVVYMHTTPNGKKYIGITSETAPEKRWGKDGCKYRGRFALAIKKYGWENIKHEILFTGLTAKEAARKEIELISLYKTDNRKYGYNVSPGGNYAADETKEKMAVARERMAGKRHPCNKPILKIDRETGRILEKYPSAEIAAKDVGCWGPSVSKCARTGEGCVGGFLWCYEKDWTETFFDKFKGKTWVKQGNGWCDAGKLHKPWPEETKARLRECGERGKAVLCVETGEEYISAQEAFRQTGIHNSCISKCCKGKALTAGGYHWEYA